MNQDDINQSTDESSYPEAPTISQPSQTTNEKLPETPNQPPQYNRHRSSTWLTVCLAIIILLVAISALYVFYIQKYRLTKTVVSSSTSSTHSTKTVMAVPAYVSYEDSSDYFSFNVPTGWSISTGSSQSGDALSSVISEPITMISPTSQDPTAALTGTVSVYGYLTGDVSSVYNEIVQGQGVNASSNVVPQKLTFGNNSVTAAKFQTPSGDDINQYYIVSGQPSGTPPGPGTTTPTITVVFDLNTANDGSTADGVSDLFNSLLPAYKNMAESVVFHWGNIE